MDYVPHTEDDIKLMLDFLGVSSIEELYSQIPKDLVLKKPLDIPAAVSEPELSVEMRNIASENLEIKPNRDFRGGGIERHYIPPIIPTLIGRGEFLTSYTPYQPEMSQGILQAFFEYQTMICELTGMDVSNASSYDGTTALGDALVAIAYHKHNSDRILVSGGFNPQSREVLETYKTGLDAKLVDIPSVNGEINIDIILKEIDDGAKAVFIQTPNFYGVVENPAKITQIADAIHKTKGLLIISANPLSLALLKSPGEIGADIAVGEAQCFGSMPNFGGPLLGYFTASKSQLRKLPGRVIGETEDGEGNKTYVMTLQAREQHIRREKATSNICTNQALNALAAAIYLSYYGKEGIKNIARRIASLARYAINEFSKIDGVHLLFPDAPRFHEFVINVDAAPDDLIDGMYKLGFAGGVSLNSVHKDYQNGILISMNECVGKNDIDEIVKIYGDLL
jgi:glycine dehydrogenase subunit 1